MSTLQRITKSLCVSFWRWCVERDRKAIHKAMREAREARSLPLKYGYSDLMDFDSAVVRARSRHALSVTKLNEVENRRAVTKVYFGS